jgi:tRNA(Ile)-lysidine synthase
MDLLQRFRHFIAEQNLFSQKDKLLLAVSGGIDSVVLCELCQKAGYDFEIAHCNFQLRGEESERDEEFVKLLADKYKVEFKVKKFDTESYADGNKLSIQEAARELRYAWFAELLTPDSRLPTPDFLLTAHHADDNNETLLMNFFRGTGLHGLTGIPVSAGDIRRPLLSFSKEELLEFAKESKLNFVEDSSNQSSKYTRNFFRNEIIPAISKVYPQVNENLKDNITRFKEIEKLYGFSMGELKKKICKQRGNEMHIPVKQLMAFSNRALIYEIISGYGFNEKQVDEVVKLAESDSGKYIQSPGNNYQIIRHRHWFIVSPVQSVEAENIIIEEGVTNVQFAMGNLQIKTLPVADCQLSVASSVSSLDFKEITFPLLLRKWKQGDYFYPLGMKKKKKLSRFFIDRKLSKIEKGKMWVIESNLRIIWVVGYRIDERFKVTEKTKQIFQIFLNP